MKLLGVPAEQFALCFLITTALTVIFFLPAISGFGHVLLGKEDVQFFLWLFWHYGQSIAHGTDPLFASEVYYPYGVSLSMSTISPLQGALYLLMPGDAFGRVTALQVLSFLLGGLFSFALTYRFTRSFTPSLTGSFIFNFSAFHFEKALHHLNYGMAMPFLALFFLCYYDALDQKTVNRRHLWLALALLLVALNEMTVAVMAGFVVFIDIFLRYARTSGVSLLSMRSMLSLGGAAVFSLLLFEASSASQLPAAFTYVVPGALFVAVCIFGVLGKDRFLRCEAADGFCISMAVCAIPTLGYLSLLALHGSYAFTPDSALVNAMDFSTGADFVLLPSELQQGAHLGIFGGLPTASESAGTYLGPAVLILLLASMFLGKSPAQEKSARDMGLICLLFSFPLIMVGSTLVLMSPFFAAPLFPLLGFLHVPARFMMFALLFISIAVALLCARIFVKREYSAAMAVAVAALVLAASWPALGSFAFDPHVPQFYLDLAATAHNASIFLYPDLDYPAIERENYYQTLHGDNLSYGTLSRFPAATNPLFALYREGNVTPEDVAPVVRSLGYDYVVVQKVRCTSASGCFKGVTEPIPAFRLDWIRAGLSKEFGNETYEDATIIVYDAKPRG